MGVDRFRIERARGAGDLEAISSLFRAYAAELPIDLSYQDFESELASLPGKYSAPEGEILIAYHEDGAAIGCVAVRPLSGEGICEMKRLYVHPQGREQGVGQALVAEIIQVAKQLGYREMLLDTLASMTPALSLYWKSGFVEIPAYYDTPVAETVFMSRLL